MAFLLSCRSVPLCAVRRCSAVNTAAPALSAPTDARLCAFAGLSIIYGGRRLRSGDAARSDHPPQGSRRLSSFTTDHPFRRAARPPGRSTPVCFGFKHRSAALCPRCGRPPRNNKKPESAQNPPGPPSAAPAATQHKRRGRASEPLPLPELSRPPAYSQLETALVCMDSTRAGWLYFRHLYHPPPVQPPRQPRSHPAGSGDGSWDPR